MDYTTERLTVRPMRQADEGELKKLLTDETVGKTYMLPVFQSEEDVKALCSRLMQLSQRTDRYIAAICLDDKLIGMVNDTQVENSSIELGYAILPQYHNQGYGTEMLLGAIGYLQAQGFTRIITGAFAENRASVRIMEKCGMKRTDQQDTVEYRGQRYTCVYYVSEV